MPRSPIGIDTTIDHLSAYFKLSEKESVRALTELSNAILLGCCLSEKVTLPRLGTFELVGDRISFTPSQYAQYFCTTRADLVAPMPRDLTERRSSQPDVVRLSLFKYLCRDYPAGGDWVHPNGKRYEHVDVQRAVRSIANLNDDYVDILHARLVSNRTRGQVAEAFSYSEATIKRRCDSVLSSILMLLIYPELSNTAVNKLYRNH